MLSIISLSRLRKLARQVVLIANYKAYKAKAGEEIETKSRI